MKRCMGCMKLYEDTARMCPHCGCVEGSISSEVFQLRPGTLLKGHYLLGKVIGFGGFGTTYLAWDETMDRPVAIKEYLPTIFATRNTEKTKVTVYAGAKAEQFEKGRKQFLEEARKLAKFTGHESIVGVYDFFEENGTAYIVMEYLEGETLTDLLKREGKLSYDAAIRIAEPILKALRDVHKEGIVHRDVAPDNIRITKDGKVKLLDFGAAREASVNHSHSLSVIYKPGYAPEEQYQSRGEQGPWTDVYALAATFYKMLTGVKPAPSLERLVHDTLVPPSQMGAKLTKNQENAILNALNVRRESRTQSAEEFLRELTSDGIVIHKPDEDDSEGEGKNPKKKKCKGKGLLIVLLVLLILGGGTVAICSALGLFRKEKAVDSEEVRVPSLVNSTWERAQELMAEAGLAIEVVGVEYSEDIEKDFVLQQSVKGGSTVEKGSVIEVVLSGGVRQIAMQNVLGMPEAEAVNLLEEIGFIVKTNEVFSVLEKGSVVESNLSDGQTYDEGSMVVLSISKGPDESKIEEEEYVVQDYLGEKVDDLQSTLERYGITLNLESDYSDTVEAGCVIYQKEVPGTKCKKGSSISLVVSKGKEMIIVPACDYRNIEEVEAELVNLGLTVTKKEEYSDTVQETRVISQFPTEGTEVEKGSTVELIVSKGKEPKATSAPTQTVATKTPVPTKKPKATATPTPKPTPRVLGYVNIHKAKVGSYVSYGQYEQDGNTKNGKEAIEWQVLAVENDKVLLISRYCLDGIPYNENAGSAVWSDSSVRKWLNESFYRESFSNEEQDKIVASMLENAKNIKYGTNGGEDTKDNVFLLSESEISTYFTTANAGVTTATKYAQKQGVTVYNVDGNKEICEWWGRTPGDVPGTAVYMQKSGALAIRGGRVQVSFIGVRPAIWLKTK